MFFRSYRAFRYYGSIFCGNSVLSHFIIRLCSVVPMELNAKMRMEKKTGNLGCFVCPLPVFFSLNYQLFLATLPKLLTVNCKLLTVNCKLLTVNCKLLTDLGVPASRRAFRSIFARSVNYARKGCRFNP